MGRGALFESTYKPQFSGHETFPLRYGWLKKAFDRVTETQEQPANRTACWGKDAMAHFGVGKNMVASMRHWAKTAGVIEEPTINSVRSTALGQLIFGPTGLDPYMEDPSTLWLIHWQLATHREKTTWFWAFNHSPTVTFDRDSLTQALSRLAVDQNWSNVATSTVKNDVACFIRTYVARQSSATSGHDGALESPLTELGLIRTIGKRDEFRFVRGPKATLGNGVFTYALMEFWSRFSKATTLSFETIAHTPGGPGRAFLLDEIDLVNRLAQLSDLTNGALRWSETAGLKQVVRNVNFLDHPTLPWIRSDYRTPSWEEAT